MSASDDSTIILWDRDTYLPLHVLRGHTGSIKCMDFDDKFLVSGSSDTTTRIWNLSTGESMGVLADEDGDEISCVIITPYFQQVITGGFDCTIKIWDINSLTKLNTLGGHTDWVYSLILYIFDNSNPEMNNEKKEKKEKKEEKKEKKEKKEKEKKEKKEKTLTWMLISGSWDNSVKVWEQKVTGNWKKNKKRKKIAKIFALK